MWADVRAIDAAGKITTLTITHGAKSHRIFSAYGPDSVKTVSAWGRKVYTHDLAGITMAHGVAPIALGIDLTQALNWAGYLLLCYVFYVMVILKLITWFWPQPDPDDRAEEDERQAKHWRERFKKK